MWGRSNGRSCCILSRFSAGSCLPHCIHDRQLILLLLLLLLHLVLALRWPLPDHGSLRPLPAPSAGWLKAICIQRNTKLLLLLLLLLLLSLFMLLLLNSPWVPQLCG
jgi:hypothetical protein